MADLRKRTLRTCIGCRDSTDKRALVRVVRTPDGRVVVDATGRCAGRGAYLCPRLECFERATLRKRFDHALRTRVRSDDSDRLRRDFESALTKVAELSEQGR